MAQTAKAQLGGARKRSVSRLKNTISAGLIAYLVLAVAGNQLSRDGEWFPVFSWSLFSEVYAHGWATRLEIIAIDGQPLDPPAYYRTLSAVFPNADKAPVSFNKLLSNIAHDHNAGAPNEDRLRKLKDTYLAQSDSVEWRIVRLVTDPIEHYKTGAIATRYIWLEGAFPSGRAE